MYKKFDYVKLAPRRYGDPTLKGLPKPAIHMFCEECGSDQTFNMRNEYYELDASNTLVDGVFRAEYLCSACEHSLRIFLINFWKEVRIGQDENGEEIKEEWLCAMKVGQWPAWEINPDRELSELIGEYKEYYKRGLVCESQSYGIGAYAYYRRIAGEIIDELLESISSLLTNEEKAKYDKALELVRSTRQTEEKIKLVQDLLPPSLKPEGYNPLKTLYGALSEGIHGKSDEDCMKQAEIIRTALVYLVNQISRAEKDKKEFTESMKKLLEKK